MKYIEKRQEPKALVDFKSDFKKKNAADAHYKNLLGDTKKAVKDALSQEQHFICCYCMSQTTIAKLNLNSHLLVRARETAIHYSGLFADNFEAKRQSIIDYHSIPNSRKELPSFCMAVLYCVYNYGKKRG